MTERASSWRSAVKKSITPDHIVRLEDGKKFKSLKRHLRTQYNMTPETYREKWGLPPDYPMVAPNYAAARSQSPGRRASAISADGAEQKTKTLILRREQAASPAPFLFMWRRATPRNGYSGFHVGELCDHSGDIGIELRTFPLRRRRPCR